MSFTKVSDNLGIDHMLKGYVSISESRMLYYWTCDFTNNGG